MARDPDGLREFVAARQDALLRSAWMLTGDWHQAEDLLQSSLARVLPRWERLQRDGSPEAYLRRTLVNLYATWWRRRWRGESPTDAAAMPERPVQADPYGDVDLRDALARLLPSLPRRQRAVLVLRYYEDLSEQETAEVLGCSVGTVKSQASRALARLRADASQEQHRWETTR